MKPTAWTRTLTWKTTLRFAALVTVTTALVLAAGGWLLDRQMRRGLFLLHEGEARELLGFLAGAERTPAAVRDRVERDSKGDAEWFFIQIHDDAGNLLFRSANLGAAMLPDLSPEGTRRVVELPGVGTVQMTEVREDGWHIQVGSPLNTALLLLRDYARVSALLLGVAALAGLGLGYGFSRVTLQPVRAIAETARRMGGDNLRERVPDPGTGDELAEVARALNQAFDRLETSFEQVRRFSADASHELKTPLALMRLNAERLRAQLGDEKATGGVDDLLEAVERMQSVIDRLLFLARADGGAFPAELKPVRMEELARDFAEDGAVLMEEAGGRFMLAKAEAGEAWADAGLLRQLLLNLVANAAQVSPAGGLVTLEVHRADGGWELVVADEGPGLPEDQLERVFERFVRYSSPSSDGRGGRTLAGHGLGLAICRSIAHLHGGSISAENRREGRGGLSVTVRLPGRKIP